MVSDLSSDHLDLFVRTPNGRRGQGQNQNSYLPHPRSSRSPLGLSMLTFVGQLIGVSLRTDAFLPFRFPSLVWKKLVAQPVDETDLAAVDGKLANFLDRLRAWRPPRRPLPF